jgi:hypothetical protein
MTDVACLKIGRVVTPLVTSQMLLACERPATAIGLAMELSIFHSNDFLSRENSSKSASGEYSASHRRLLVGDESGDVLVSDTAVFEVMGIVYPESFHFSFF